MNNGKHCEDCHDPDASTYDAGGNHYTLCQRCATRYRFCRVCRQYAPETERNTFTLARHRLCYACWKKSQYGKVARA